MGRTLLDKIWDAHTVRAEEGGRTVLYIDRQYIHEVTSPVAFARTRAARRRRGTSRPQSPPRPTTTSRPSTSTSPSPSLSRGVRSRRWRANCARYGIEHFGMGRSAAGHRAHHRPRTGIHAAGHDDRLRRQPHLDARSAGRRGVRRGNLGGRNGTAPASASCQAKPRAMRITVDGALRPGVEAKDVILYIISQTHRFGRHGPFHRVRRRARSVRSRWRAA